ncbi:MAG: stage III sporulation protein AF [Lachnospiraceae bacterium]|nr:stage III sporulation protein AF [Lachnospiraceae bacterium]
MELIYEWMRNLVFYSLLVSVVMNVLPDSEYQKYIRFFLGMLLIIVVITPVLQILGLDETLAANYNILSLEESWQETMDQVEINLETEP